MILVSGSNGFLGNAITNYFGDEAIGIARTAKLDAVSRQLVCDLSDPNFSKDTLAAVKSEKFSCLIHCAGVTPWGVDPNFELDIVMARNALAICRELGIPRIVYTSGWIVYDGNAQSPYSESSTPLKPATAYGESKLATENYLKKNAKETTVINLRLASIYGPGQTTAGLIPNLVKTALSRQPISINSKETKRDYLYIDDLLGALKDLGKLDLMESVDLNIGSGSVAQIIDVAKAVQAAVAKYDIVTDIKLEEPLQEGIPANNMLDITKAQGLGLLRKTTDFNTGISNYVDWVKHEAIS